MTDEPTTTVTTSTAAPALTTTSVVTAPPAKPGYLTTEFYFKLGAVLLSSLFASGLLTNDRALAIAGMAATVLTALGYTVSRTLVKVAGLMLVLGMAASTSACAARQRATAGVTALIDCTAPTRAAVVNDVGVALRDFLLKYVSGDGRTVDTAQLKLDAHQLKGEVLGSCGIVAALAALAQPEQPGPQGLFAEPRGPDPSQWQAALDLVRADLGVGAVKPAAR